MRRAYNKFYKMSRNEMFAAFALTIMVVVLYSFWGSYMIKNQAAAPATNVGSLR